MLWALVMAGGRGTRLWPLADQKNSKPFLKLLPGRKTLLEETLKRITPVVPANRIFIIGNREHLNQIRRLAPRVPRSQIIGEPVSRNTAPTIALAAALISKRDSEASLLVLPADHWIEPARKFHEAVRRAFKLSSKTHGFTIFGARPSFPSSSYGYLWRGRKVGDRCYQLKRFVEKPNESRARTLLRAGCLWHAGIFLAPVRTILDSFERYANNIIIRIAKLNVKNGKITPEKVFRMIPDISMDYAVLEKLSRAYVLDSGFRWCDIGIWKSFESLWLQDRFKNAVLGSCLPFGSSGNIVYSKEKPTCLFGVDNLVVVDTPRALLIMKKESTEAIRDVANLLSKKNSVRKSS